MYIEVLGVPVSLTHLAGVEPVSKVEAHRRSVGRIYHEQWQRVETFFETLV